MAERRRQTARTRTLIMSAALAALASVAACAPAGGDRSGSTTPSNDLVGAGGRIDQTYRDIYHPGSGTDF